jgi:AMMECR1 domain-containing protein
MNPEVQVRTLEPKADNYTDEGVKKRKWGVNGVIIAHHNSHGLCYDVRHEDGSIGTYDPNELELNCF